MPHTGAVESHHLLQQYGLAHGQNTFLQSSAPHQTLQQHGVPHHPQLVQVTGAEAHSALRQSQHLLQRQQQQIPHHQPTYGTGAAPVTTPTHLDYVQASRKRSRPTNELSLDLQGLSGLGDTGEDIAVDLSSHGHHSQPQNVYQQAGLNTQPQHHHHHRLPNHPPPSKMRRSGYGDSPTSPQQHGPPSVVGQEGMPPPAPRPKGPKLKFTPEDDQLLVDLKEKKNLTWKQIADFFPGRSSGTLQVRYCTKLKAKTTVWSDDTVQRLHNAMREYENDKWRIISSKVGSGFSPAACKEKAAELSGIIDTTAGSATEGGTSLQSFSQSQGYHHDPEQDPPGSAASDATSSHGFH